MKTTFKCLMVLLAAGLFLSTTLPTLQAEDSDSPVTLTGLLVCGKCTLHLCSECQNVLQVQQDGKTVNYWLKQNGVSKDFHSNVCQTDGEKVSVTGTVKEKDGKEILTASKIETAK